MERQMKYFITGGNCPQFENKKIEPQGHQNDKVRYNTRLYIYVLKNHIMDCKLSKKWNKLFILEVKSVDYGEKKKKRQKSLIHT